MFKWLLNLFRKKDKALKNLNYGDYKYKPIVLRAITVIADKSNDDITHLVSHGLIRLNNIKLEMGHLQNKLESGTYQIIINDIAVYNFRIR